MLLHTQVKCRTACRFDGDDHGDRAARARARAKERKKYVLWHRRSRRWSEEQHQLSYKCHPTPTREHVVVVLISIVFVIPSAFRRYSISLLSFEGESEAANVKEREQMGEVNI